MPGAVNYKIEGGRELAAAFQSLADDFDMSKATVRNTMQRGLVEAGQQTADMASSLAPDDPATPAPDLHTSIAVGTKLTDRQRSIHKKLGKMFAEAFIGVTEAVNAYAHLVEFGTAHTPPRPFLRPAWDATKEAVLTSLSWFLTGQLERSRKRAAAKALKSAR